MRGLDGYSVLMEEHISRRNQGLSTEHPMEMIYRLKAEARAELLLNADKHPDSTNEEDGQ